MDRPGYLNPFILEAPAVAPEALSDRADLYLPEGPGPFPVVVLVPGMLQEPPEVGPRGWPVFQGYASALAQHGVAAAVVEHSMAHGPDYDDALRTVLLTRDAASARSDIDGDRSAFWVFSAGGPVALALLAQHGDQFGPLVLTYPLLEAARVDGWPSREDAVAGLNGRSLVMTTVGQEIPDFVPGQQSFLAAARAAGADVEHIELPEAHHGFDSQEPTEDGRRAVSQAVETLARHLLGG